MEVKYCDTYDPLTRTCTHTQMQPHTCNNPDCGAWNDEDHKEPALCIVCKERPAEPYSETCASLRCEKFLGEYDLGIL
jgi:hypothetical protein